MHALFSIGGSSVADIPTLYSLSTLE